MKKCDEKGQALFEFLVFTPIFLGLIAVMLTVSGAINGSINQQKVIRGYYYNVIKWNPNVISTFELNLLRDGATPMKRIGLLSLGFNEKTEGNAPFSTCYKMHTFGTSSGETCDIPKTSEGNTEFIRVMSIYGICGAGYNVEGNSYRPNIFDSSCSVKEN